MFPEGRRNSGDVPLLPFKTGLFHVATARPGVDLVPVWIGNLNKVLPRGEVIPVPLVCTVVFGAPIRLMPGEERDHFLARARGALMALSEVGT
jgi:1-acyl-sn-glycerol-3-phosphate acyltransferase